MIPSRRKDLTFALVGLVGAISCTGKIRDPSGAPVAARPNAPAGVGPREVPAEAPSTDLAWPVRYGGTPSALRRLSRDELVVTMRMLTGSAPARSDLPQEPRIGRGQLFTTGLSYVATEVPKLDRAIGAFAVEIAPTLRARSGCALSDQAQRDCLLTWSTSFATKAFRRPPTAAEISVLGDILATADGTSDADTTALESVLGTIFFAPSFLYRIEVGAPSMDGSTTRALSASEIAVRLSFLATLGPPDAELSSAAAAGRLSDGRERALQFERLSRTEMGQHAASVLVLEWLGANEPKIHTKSARYLGGLAPDFEASIRASVERAIALALGSANPRIANLLSTSAYLDDPAILEVTRLAGTATSATEDTIDTGRAGILMHPQVIAAHTKEDGFSPFQLGAFLKEDLLCQPPPPPPANATAMALTDTPPGASLREIYQHKIMAGGACLSCHSTFAPLGYAFLPFDPVGRWLERDPSGKAWDLGGAITILQGALSFTSPRDLVEKLAVSPQVHGCFAQAALQSALGRQLVNEDERLVRALDQVIRQTKGDYLAVLETIVAAPEFAISVAGR
jgi:uncharacterized protein DUF1588/uncharacterized protein DUF1592/uncharacterized protein DUF1595/uncharacterized protein DUF1585